VFEKKIFCSKISRFEVKISSKVGETPVERDRKLNQKLT